MAESTVVAAEIKAINKASVHRICSGEGILDLAGAVKELIENSLDSGANNVDIRLKEYGADLIEVADNGPGVSPEYYQALSLKYYTSKISEFADLQNISTFGFRGEALSSLCALSKVTITTRTRDEPIAARLVYDHSGLIVSQTCVARCVGTTVSVALLFSPLPVRFKELRRNVRREFARLLAVLQAYAMIAKRVRLLCTNQAGKAGRTVVVQTHGSLSMRENVVRVFGTKTIGCLEWMDLFVTDVCRVEGFFSKPAAGTGRASRDRQFFFINGRPVDMPKVAKVLNEVYRSFNSVQFPMAVLNFLLPTTAYDINVTPDKRKIILQAESDLMAALKLALQKSYVPGKDSSTLEKVGHASVSGKLTTSENLSVPLNEKTGTTQGPDVGEGGSSGGPEEDDEFDREVSISEAPHMAESGSEQNNVACKVSLKAQTPWYNLNAKSKENETRLPNTSVPSRPLCISPINAQSHSTVQAKLTGFISRNKRSVDESGGWPPLKKCMLANTVDPNGSTPREGVANISDEGRTENVQGISQPHNLTHGSLNDQILRFTKSDKSNGNKGGTSSSFESGMKETGVLSVTLNDTRPKSLDIGSISQILSGSPDEHSKPRTTHLLTKLSSMNTEHGHGLLHKSNHFGAGNEKRERGVTGPRELKGAVSVLRFNRLAAAEVDEAVCPPKQTSVVAFDMERLRKKFNRGMLQHECNKGMKASTMKRSFTSATITVNCIGSTRAEKEVALEAATKELEQNFSKADLKSMKVLGQFNLRFILAKFGEDIFILDQHASDEKYKFEHLIKTAALNSQQLLRDVCRPVPLELHAADETIVTTHMATFRKNGFDFLENKEAPPGYQLQLSAVPFSKNVVLGIEDVHELIALLVDQPAIPLEHEHQGFSSGSSSWLPRPSRVREMLALQACKSSIMIGDALSKKQMEEVVSHLAELEAPWRCPHGRPTIRHMVDLSSIVNLSSSSKVSKNKILSTLDCRASKHQYERAK